MQTKHIRVSKQTFSVSREHHIRVPGARLRRAHQDRVISMGLDMLLQILGTLESLAAEVALVRFERNMDSNMRGDMVALDSRSATAAPLASQVKVVGTLAADMALTNVFLTGQLPWFTIRRRVNLHKESQARDISQSTPAINTRVPRPDEQPRRGSDSRRRWPRRPSPRPRPTAK